MLTMTERQEKIDAIRHFPARLSAEVQKLTPDYLDAPCDEGVWTVRQVIHHIADSHLNAFIRTKLLLTEDHPTLKPYNQDAWAELIDASDGSIHASLAILQGVHERWTAVLSSLPEAAFSRTALHPEIGPITLDDILTIYARHGEEHLAQMGRRG
jgi:uncharacterized damage-inducible protein DinB